MKRRKIRQLVRKVNKMYKGISVSCTLFGLFLFWSALEIVRYQQTAGEIIAMLFVGMMGSVMGVMGLFGLWECWQKRG